MPQLLQGAGVWMCLGRRRKRREDVGGGRQCLRVGVTDMFDHVCELPASNGCKSRDLDQREPPARRHRKTADVNSGANGEPKISQHARKREPMRGTTAEAGGFKRHKSVQGILSTMFIFRRLKVCFFCCLWQHKGRIFSIFIARINRLAALMMEAADASF